MAEAKITKQNGQRGKGALRVYAKLREDILRLNVAPGELLDEVRISNEFNLSRSPVREALVRLASEGLIKTLPNKSTIVAPLKIEEFASYIDALDLVQRSTSRLAAELRTREDLESIRARQREFEATLNKGDALAMIEANREFHVAISAASHNTYLSNFNARLLDEGRRLLRLYFRSFDDLLPREFSDEHHAIIDAIDSRNAELAESLAHAHAMQVSDRFLSYLSTRRTADIAVVA